MAKVMLVEDDNNLREIYEARLQAEGYTIVSAHDGEEALVVAKAEKPDLVISDVMMPKISGFEMLDILRNTDGLKDVKVIMLTALGQSDDQQRADKLGADRYLVKSQVTLEDIVKAAHELLGDATPAEPAAADTAAAPPAATPNPVPAPDPVSDAATPQPAPASAPPVADSAAATTAADDQVMADAVDKLIADTTKDDSPEPEPKAADNAEAVPAEEAEPAEAKDKPADENPSNSHVEIANKKVITPIDSSPGKDINQLLAEEEAKEIASTPGHISQPSAAGEQAAASTAAEQAAVETKIEDFVAGATSEPDTPAPASPETPVTETPVPAAETPSPAPAEPAPAAEPKVPAATPSQPGLKPIVVNDEDAPSGAPAASASGNPGVPAAPADNQAPPDPNTIAL
jgi:CheY-like chemotaxis protein